MRTIDIPAGEIGVLDLLDALDTVRLLIETAVLAVHIAIDIRMHQHVVQRGIERCALIRRAAVDGNTTERIVPRRAGRFVHLREARALGDFRFQGRLRIGQADIGNANPNPARPLCRIKAQPYARTLARFRETLIAVARTALRGRRARLDLIVLPGTDIADGLIETGYVVKRVVAA